MHVEQHRDTCARVQHKDNRTGFGAQGDDQGRDGGDQHLPVFELNRHEGLDYVAEEGAVGENG